MKFLFSAFCFLFISFSLIAQKNNYKDLMEQDWPELKHYRESNQKVITRSNWPEVVFMGNSITQGWVQANPGFFSSNNYAGRGIGGQTTPQMLIRFTPDVIDLRPQAVVILAGTNDIAANTGFSSVKMITDNIKAMTQLAMQNNIQVILCSILPVYDYPWRPGLEPVSKIAEINSWLENYAAENDLIYLDFFSHMANSEQGMKKEFSEDGVHPNKNGYNTMEPLVQQAIKKALRK